mgnify:CR=1 FL=1
MKKINDFINKIIGTYSIVYFIILQLLTIGIISYETILLSPTIPDAILTILGIIIFYIIINVCFLIPILFTVAIGSIISFFMSISVPLFLLLSFFEIIGSQNVDILQYGFFKILIICILITPFGYLNLKSLKVFESW